MNALTLKNGKRVEYKEGFLNPKGIEIIVGTELTGNEKKDFKNKISYERDVSAVFYEKPTTWVDFILNR